jgi:hypothetical protein
VKFIGLNGKPRSISGINKYLIKWHEKSRSNPQFKVKQYLEPFWCSDIVFEEFPVAGTRLKVDILNLTKKIAIEVHGQQHEKFNPFFHDKKRSKFLKSIKNDFLKEEFLKKNNINLLIIYDNEVSMLSREFFLEKLGVML